MLLPKERWQMEHQEHSDYYMHVHPIEMNHERDLEETRNRIQKEHSQVHNSLRNTRIFNFAGGIAASSLIIGAVYEIGTNLNEGLDLAKFGIVAAFATGIGMLRQDRLEDRDTQLRLHELNFPNPNHTDQL